MAQKRRRRLFCAPVEAPVLRAVGRIGALLEALAGHDLELPCEEPPAEHIVGHVAARVVAVRGRYPEVEEAEPAKEEPLARLAAETEEGRVVR